MSDLYILDDANNVVGPVSVEEWGPWFEEASTSRRRVVRREAYAEAPNDDGDWERVEVSTVFLGIDHRWVGHGPPVVFETMVFGGPRDGEMLRCSTWEEAVVQHNEIAASVLAENGPDDGLTLEQREALEQILDV